MKIIRIQLNGLVYYECTFMGGNLFAYSINDLICQLWEIYGFKLSLFSFNLN